MGLTIAERRWAILGLGFLTWVVPLYTYFVTMWIDLLYPLIYVALVILVIIAVTASCSLYYLPVNRYGMRKEGIIIGIIWLILNLLLDVGYRLTYAPVWPDIKGYIFEKAWMFLFIPATCIVVSQLVEQKVRRMTTATNDQSAANIKWRR